MIKRWFATGVATFVALWLVPGIQVVGGAYAAPILTALVLSFFNVTIKPIMQLFSLPISFLTFGLFALIINAVVLELAGNFSTALFGQGLTIDNLGSALLASLIISIVSALVKPE